MYNLLHRKKITTFPKGTIFHVKWVEVLSNPLCILHLWNYADVSAVQHHLFACWLMPRRPDLIILCMFLFYISLFPLIQDASPPVVSIYIWNYSTSKLVTSFEVTKATSSSTITTLIGCCSFFSVVKMHWMTRTWNRLDSVCNNHTIIFFAQTIVIIEVNTWTEVTFVKVKVHVNKFSWLKVTGVKYCSLWESCNCFLCNRLYMVLCLFY